MTAVAGGGALPPEPARRVPAWRSLRVRIAAAFVAALVAMAASQAWVVSQQGPLSQTLRLVVDGYVPLSKQVARLSQDHERVQRDLERSAADRPRPAAGVLAIYARELSDDLAITGILARAMRERVGSDGELGVLARVLGNVERVERLWAEEQDALVAWEAAPDADTAAASRRRMRAAAQQLTAELDRLTRTLDERIVGLTATVEQQQARATAGAVVTFALAGTLALALLLVSLVALRPIGQLTGEVQRMAQGAQGARVEVRGRDEVGLLAAEFNALAAAIETRDRRLTERNAELDVLSRHLSSVLDGIEDALVVVEHGVVTLSNPAARARWGVAVGAPPPAPLASAVVPGTRAVDGPDGSHHAVRAAAFGEDGVVAVVRDVTDLVLAQGRLARSERLALVGQMLAQITHEVRNPLNAMSLNAELLAEELEARDAGPGTEPWDFLGTIRGEVARLTAVTGHYLQLARRPPARPSPTDVVAVLDEVARLLEPEVDAHGARLVLDTRPVPPQLLDGNQLRQAVLNVVRNALEAGARTLTLAVDASGSDLHLSLHDDGPGMDAADIARATDPFFSTKASGTGLGLAIVRQIVEDHGGRVELDSAAGRGTTVRLVWPSGGLAAAPQADTPPTSDAAVERA